MELVGQLPIANWPMAIIHHVHVASFRLRVLTTSTRRSINTSTSTIVLLSMSRGQGMSYVLFPPMYI